MSACPHTGDPEECICAPGCGCDRPADGDPCPRCDSRDTWATQTWEEPDLVCRSCGYGT